MNSVEFSIVDLLKNRIFGMTVGQIKASLSDIDPVEVKEAIEDMISNGHLERGGCGRHKRIYASASGLDAASWYSVRNDPDGGW